MDFAVIALIVLLVLCLVEIVIGIARRSGALVVIGVIFALIAALALFLAIKYSGALYFNDSGYIL